MGKMTRCTLFAISMLLLLNACSVSAQNSDGEENKMLNEIRGAKSENEKCEVRMKYIIKSLDEKNGELLKSMFSKQSIMMIEDIDTKIEELFTFYQGSSISCQGRFSYSENRSTWGKDENERKETGHAYQLITGNYDVKTDVDSYKFKIAFYDLNEEDPGGEGLVYIEIITDAFFNENVSFKMQSNHSEPGIYIQE